MRGVDVSSKNFWARCKVIRHVMCCSWRKAVSTAIREYESNGVTVFRTSREVSTESISWKTPLTFGKHEGKSLIAVLASDKEYIAWCFWFKLEYKYPELQWLKQNLKPKELSQILTLQDGLE